MVVVWVAVFVVLGVWRHERFATHGFDIGIYDQAAWLLSRFRSFMTVRGLDVFGHHMTPIFAVFAPFYWLGAGPVFLLVVQVVAQASGAAAVFLLARDRLGARWPAVALAGALLLHPSYQFLAWEQIHPETLAIAPVLFAYWAARERRWPWFWLAAVLAIACKEDVALAFVPIGLLIAAWGDRRRGLLVAAGAALWFLATTRLVLPLVNGLGPFYSGYFGDFGDDGGEVVRNIVAHPGRVWEVATRANRLDYYRMMLAPVAFLGAVGLPGFLVAVPMLAVNVLSSFPYAQEIQYHYSAMVVAGVILGTVEAVALLARTPAARTLLVGLVVATSLGATVAWGPSPIGVRFRSGIWALETDERTAARADAVATVPDGASVSASYNLVPHLTHRPNVYEWPVPWRAGNWGVRGENLHDPADVDWIVVEQALLDRDGTELLDRLLAGEFALRFEREGLLVAQRLRPAAPPPLAAPIPAATAARAPGPVG